jgi:hypothetical protein
MPKNQSFQACICDDASYADAMISFFHRFCCLLALALAPVHAATVLTMEDKKLDGSAPHTLTTSVDSYAMKVQSSAAESSGTFIYRDDKKVFWMINDQQKVYMEMTPEMMSGMANKMEAAMKQAEAAMAHLPPEQQAQFREMLKKNAPAAAGAESKVIYEKVASGEKVGSYVCDKYAGKENGVLVAEAWTVSPSTLEIDPASLGVLKNMGEFFQKGFGKMMRQNKQSFSFFGSNEPGSFQGIPVKEIFYEGGKPVRETKLLTSKKESLPPAIFEIPAGYSQQSMPGL